jgi:BirA family transcriptional regulator, biotin operon repressor / biotin---[acetyl-CoA-carboxylase] ligase
VRGGDVEIPSAVVAEFQTQGVGSRGNSWSALRGNLFFSFVLPLSSLPKDLKLESSSIYFSFLLKEVLAELSSDVWLKWPNDFYLENKKAGGAITHIVGKNIICGIGLNLKEAPENFGVLDIEIEKKTLLDNYFKKIEKNISWKQVFSKYELEFDKSKDFFTHNEDGVISLKEATLQSDGSIISDGERIFSIR